MVKKIKT